MICVVKLLVVLVNQAEHQVNAIGVVVSAKVKAICLVKAWWFNLLNVRSPLVSVRLRSQLSTDSQEKSSAVLTVAHPLVLVTLAPNDSLSPSPTSTVAAKAFVKLQPD